MNVAMTLAVQILFMFLFILLGFILFKTKKISQQGSKDMGSILLYVVIPCAIINSFLVERTQENLTALLETALISALAMAAACLVSWLIYGKKDGIACFSSAFSNAAFMGIPLIQAVIGPHAVFYISMMIVLVNALQWTFGVYVMTGDKSVMNPGKLKSNPVILAVIAGLIILLCGIPVGEFPRRVLSTLTALNTPLAMIVTGVYLAQTDIIGMLKNKKAYMVSLIRLVVIPLLTILVMKFLPVGTPEMKMAVLIAAACPVGSNVSIFAQQFNKDYKASVEQVCLSTLLCIITLPLAVILISM